MFSFAMWNNVSCLFLFISFDLTFEKHEKNIVFLLFATALMCARALPMALGW